MDKTISKTNCKQKHKNLTNSLQKKEEDIIVNLPILIKEVDNVLLQLNKTKNERKNQKKRIFLKDKSGYYIM
jgi:hypothetical protein